VALWPRYSFTMSLTLWDLISYIFFQNLLVASILHDACRQNGYSCCYANPHSNFFSPHICSTCNFVYWLRSFTACLLFISPFREQSYDDSTAQRGRRSLSTCFYNPFNVSKEPFIALVSIKTSVKSIEGLFHFIWTDESQCSQSFDPGLDCKVLVNLSFGSMVKIWPALLCVTSNVRGKSSGVFKGRRARHLLRALPFCPPPPFRCYAHEFSLFLVKNVLSTHPKADHM